MEEEIDNAINRRLAGAIRAVIDQQVDQRDPPETLETLERLMDDGFSEEEAYVLIGHAVGREIAESIVVGQPINLERFKAALNELPNPFTKPRKADSEE